MTPNYFMHRAINVLDVIDHNTKPLTTEAYLDALGDDSMMLEAATLEEIAATYMYDLDTPEGAMMEAITTTRARLPKTMSAFGRALNQQLNSSGMEAGEAQIKAPAKSGQIAVMTALFPLSDGQSISVVFHSPSGDPSKITTHDDLVAFRFLLNKRDVTHVVAPSGGQDISLKQTCLTLSNLAERNSAKFQSKQAENKAKEDKLATMQASTEQLQTEAADTFEKADRLVEQDEADQKALSQTQAMLDKQIAKNEELRRQLANMGGNPAPSQTTKQEPKQGITPEGGAEPAKDPSKPAEPEEVEMPTDTIRKVKQELNMDGESTLSNGAKIAKVLRDEGGSLEGYITLTTPGGKSYVLKSPSSQGGSMEDTAKTLYKAYREGKADKYLGGLPQLAGQQQPIEEEVSQKLAALPQDPAGWIDGAHEICRWLGKQVESGRVDMAEYTAITREIGETINLKSASLPPEMTQLKADKTSKNGAAIVNLNTVYGDSVWVSKDDLESDKKMLPLFNSRGDKLIELKSREGRTDNVIARENLVIPAQIKPDPEVIEPTSPPADPAPATLHWYGLKARPLSNGAQPAGHADYIAPEDPRLGEVSAGRPATDTRWGAVAYADPLSDELVAQYELVDLSSAPAFVWDEQARASKFAELSALTNAMLQDGNGSVEIWQQVMTPNSPQVEKNPFYVDGKYETTEVTKAFQEAGYSGTVRQMFNQFADQQWAAIEQANKSPEELEEERREKERQEGVSALNKLIEGVNLPAGWSMQVDLAFGTRAALFVDTPDLPNGEEHEGYLVTANANDSGELDGTFNLTTGNGDPISDGHTKWQEISADMQAYYQKDEAAAQPPAVEPTPADPATPTENQWGETDPDVLALLQQAEELRTTETNSERYLAELQRIGGELDKAGAVERHEPYLHTVSDRLTELMEAEGV
ncbi:hypothetical protein [Aeromonas hydrophila]|uniref:defense against restriction DarA-related protein n=1 Tax=Aeromonas hydrophila TaxID=644 RepID=UPI003D1D0B70